MKAALGNNYETVNIAGKTVRTDAVGNSITDNAGVFANRANIGTYHRNDFVVIPELGLEVGYLIGARWRATFGYDLMYWASVQRSGDAIDLNIDPRNIPGGLEDTATHFPQFEFCGTNFWAQGLRPASNSGSRPPALAARNENAPRGCGLAGRCRWMRRDSRTPATPDHRPDQQANERQDQRHACRLGNGMRHLGRARRGP